MPVTMRQVSLGGAVACGDERTPAADIAQPARPQPPAVRLHPDAGDEAKLAKIFADANLPDSARETAVENYLSDAKFQKQREYFSYHVRTREEFKSFLDLLDRSFPDRAGKPKWNTLQELKDACHKFGEYHVVYADWPENKKTFRSAILDRLLHSDTHPTATSDLLRPLMVRDQYALPILAGESGSGKTHHLLTCDVDAVTVYVLSLPAELESVNTAEMPEVAQKKWVEGVVRWSRRRY
jgi:hypothetical protein